ncbi:hypothetical protein D3C78_1298040 [compost metagenome]
MRHRLGVPAADAQRAGWRAVEAGEPGGQALQGIVPAAATLGRLEQVGRPVALHQGVDLGQRQGLDPLLQLVAALAGEQALARLPGRQCDAAGVAAGVQIALGGLRQVVEAGAQPHPVGRRYCLGHVQGEGRQAGGAFLAVDLDGANQAGALVHAVHQQPHGPDVGMGGHRQHRRASTGAGVESGAVEG